jgi:hypothetical protein
MFDVYIFDEQVYYYLCSLSPSRECHYIGARYEAPVPYHELSAWVANALDMGEALTSAIVYRTVLDVNVAETVERSELPSAGMGKYRLPERDWDRLFKQCGGDYDKVMEIVVEMAKEEV